MIYEALKKRQELLPTIARLRGQRMRILALVHGIYGERIVRNIRARAPQGWEIESLQAPRALPIIVEELEEFLPPTLPQIDLILHLAETHQAAQLLPGVVRLTGARVVIAPVDNPPRV